MTRADHQPHHRGAALLRVGTTALVLSVGAWLIHDGFTATHPPQPAAAAAAQPATAPTAPTERPSQPHTPPTLTGPELPPSDPVRLRIPDISVDAPFVPLGLDSRGELTTPPTGRRNVLGWYSGGTSPGAQGTAVVVGHVDDSHGPAVLYRLGLLRPGHTITVTRQDRRTATFTVDAVRSHPKDGFPAQAVYAPTGRAELRVITCGGHYDPRTGYDANTVVYAHLTSVRP
ncbi:class F sortase (plasmid) [Kitasatospora sp. NBC_00070]|uniref:class F sortase n=1 Tax=Kitasatospora sp. NBC_00070 TaxID=2975962 RepID=UPI002F90FCCB